jgi:alpha-tubulin suppressor-like RCC1 family protein
MPESQIINKKAYVWAFGKNKEGELALGVNKDALLPRFVTGVKSHSAKWISSSNNHSALITQEGLLLVCGSTLHGKLGLEGVNKTNINKFQVIHALSKKIVKQVACSDYHTLCLTEDGTVYQFGGNQVKDKKDKQIRPLSAAAGNNSL